MKPLVSVIIPVYNVEEYLCECLDSVVNQTYKELEIILVVDKSTDKSTEICEEYAKRDDRIVIVRGEKTGPALARNMGYDVSTGEFIFYSDSDDYLELSAIETLVDKMLSDDYECVIYDALQFTNDEYDCDENHYIHKQDFTNMSGAAIAYKSLVLQDYNACVYLLLYRRDFLEKNNIRFYDGILGEDELFMYNVYLNANKIGQCRKVLYHHRIRPGSLMTRSDNREKKFISYSVVFNEMYRTPVDSEEKKKAKNAFVLKIAKSLELMYRLMDENKRKEHRAEYEKFKKEVIGNKGFGDLSLVVRFYCRPLGIVVSKGRRICRKVKYKLSN